MGIFNSLQIFDDTIEALAGSFESALYKTWRLGGPDRRQKLIDQMLTLEEEQKSSGIQQKGLV